MPEVETTIAISAPPAVVYAVAKQVEQYPEFMPDVESVEVLQEDGPRRLTRWVGIVREFGRRLRWTEEDYWDDARLLCTFRATEGDWDRYEGLWSFTGDDKKTVVTLRLEYDVDVPLIGPLIRQILAKLVRRNCEVMLEALKARVLEQQALAGSR